MHFDYQCQLKFKREQAYNTLSRIGGVEAPEVFATLGMEHAFRYRNKGSFPFALVNGNIELGFFAPKSHRLVPLEDCLIQDQHVMNAALCVRDWARDWGVVPYDEATHTGELRHVVVRSASNGDVMVVVITNGDCSHKQHLVEYLINRCPNVKSIIHNINDQRTNVIMGSHFETLWGEDYITEQYLGLSFKVGASSFLQVNHAQTLLLYQTALTFLDAKPDETILDIYCGIGTITLNIAKTAKQVIGIENVSAATENAQTNAGINGIANTQFICGNAEDVLPDLINSGLRVDAVVLDPPRKGCEKEVINAVAASGADRIVYVSCNPATLARDVALLRERGYNFIKAQPVDMFPHSAHVETVALLQRCDLHI